MGLQTRGTANSMQCEKFTDLERRSEELESRHAGDDKAFCDEWLFDAVTHIRALRRRYEQSNRTPYRSAISQKDWKMIEEATGETKNVHGSSKLVSEGWPDTLLLELRDLEAEAWH